MIYIISCKMGDYMLPTTSQQGFPAYQDDLCWESKNERQGYFMGIMWVDGWCFMISIGAFMVGLVLRFFGVNFLDILVSHDIPKDSKPTTLKALCTLHYEDFENISEYQHAWSLKS